MAVFNGSQYIHEQIASILPQLGIDDEIVAVDDASQDSTVAILEGFRDQRIRIIRQAENRGVVRSFERALQEAKGEIVFLCDQDDLWREDKVQKVKAMFLSSSSLSLVLSDCLIMDAHGDISAESWIKSGEFHAGLLRNLVRNRFLGCTMAFRRSLLEYCLPFPDNTPMHDMWIGMVNQLVGRTGFIPEPLISYRRHSNTVTTGKHASPSQMVRWRFALVENLLRLYLRQIAFRSKGPNGLLR
jgi:glycosyltransferase involved in cell wall biosynthesis